MKFPSTLLKEFKLEYFGDDNNWHVAKHVIGNRQRLFKLEIDIKISKIRLTPIKAWGDGEEVNIFSFDVR